MKSSFLASHGFSLNGISPGVLAVAVVAVLQATPFAAIGQERASIDQEEASPELTRPTQLDAISVVGSQIAGGGAQAALPVISLDAEQIAATGATDGNELIRSLPQMGDVTWNPTWLSGGNSNAARGDVGNISLRNIGSSNTLLLINGRRSVVHPTTAQVDGGISATTFNSNAIPMFGLERMDMLLDGAAAIYGSDAIAGVVNVVTQQNLADGGGIQLEYGKVSGSHREDYQLNGYFGKDFADGRGNVSLMYGLAHRSAQLSSDQWYTATSDRRDFLGQPTASSVNGLSNITPYGRFQSFSGGAPAGGTYYVDADGNLTSGTTPAALFYDPNAEAGVTLSPEIDRASIFSNARFDLTDNLQLFGELSYYRAKSESWIGSATTATNLPTYVRPDAYWVPEELRDGADAISVSFYRFADAGIRPVEVDNYQARVLAGLRGWTDNGWNWETALLWSKAQATDDMVGVDVTRFVESINRTDSSAYNPFNGAGGMLPPTGGDGTPSDGYQDFMAWTTRQSTSELALWDFKINRPDLFSWYAGDIGIAAGVEVRYESLRDDRDPIIDGTHTYTDWYTGTEYQSNFFGHSSTPDSYGSRNVKSAFLELAVPLVSPALGIPLVQSLDLQIAGRYEDYSDVGDVAKPKFALAWQVNDSLLLRGSVSEGFKAPNLELLNISPVSRFLGYPDYVRYEALVAKGEAPSWSSYINNANNSYTTVWETTGNADLSPELSRNESFGFVFEPTFIPERAGRFSFGIDWWRIEIENPIGALSAQNHLYYDAYLRVTQGTVNPVIERFPATAEDEALFAGSGLEAVGPVQLMRLTYENMNQLAAEGVDYSFSWRLRDTAFGNFALLLNVAQLKSYSQEPTNEERLIQQAIDAGQLNIVIPPLGADQVGINGAKPEWKGTATLVWNYDDWTVRVRNQYTGSLVAGLWADGSDFVVGSTQRWNLSVKRDFTGDLLNGFSVEVGGRNIFDKDPPLNSAANYLAALHEPYGAYYYVNVQKAW